MRLVKRIATVAILLAMSSPPLADAKTPNAGLDGLAYLGADPNSGCSTLSVHAVIHGVERCLRAGRSCQHQYARQYQRYGFNCVGAARRYHLTRRPVPTKGRMGPAGAQPGGLAYLGTG